MMEEERSSYAGMLSLYAVPQLEDDGGECSNPYAYSYHHEGETEAEEEKLPPVEDGVCGKRFPAAYLVADHRKLHKKVGRPKKAKETVAPSKQQEIKVKEKEKEKEKEQPKETEVPQNRYSTVEIGTNYEEGGGGSYFASDSDSDSSSYSNDYYDDEEDEDDNLPATKALSSNWVRNWNVEFQEYLGEKDERLKYLGLYRLSTGNIKLPSFRSLTIFQFCRFC